MHHCAVKSCLVYHMLQEINEHFCTPVHAEKGFHPNNVCQCDWQLRRLERDTEGKAYGTSVIWLQLL